jgi:hypothetical protein
MKWVIAFVLTAFIPTAEVAAQEVSALAPNSLSSIPANSPSAQAQPAPQAICDDAVRGTWEIGLTYVPVKFRSSQFAATMSGVNSTFSYYVRNHFAIEGSVTSAFGSQSFDTADAKYMFYGGGAKLSVGNRKLQPFVMRSSAVCTCFHKRHSVTTDLRCNSGLARNEDWCQDSGCAWEPTMCAPNCTQQDKITIRVKPE